MKKTVYAIAGVIVVALLLGFATSRLMAEEKMSTTEGVIKVLLDNDQVRVVEAVRHPGTVVPMHTHPKYLAYFFGPWKGRFTSEDGKVSETEFPAGKLLWSPNGKTHAIEVIGDTDQHVLVIELKK